MITQFVNQIEHHPESVFVHADTMARMKRDTLADATGWFHNIQAFWRRISARQPRVNRNIHVQCGDVKRGCQETF